jgi:O-antigen/teichoic acid export membrane protein
MGKGLVRNVVLGSAGGAATTFATFASSVAVARLLGPEGAGSLAYALLCVIVVASIADLGIETTLQRFLPDLDASGHKAEAAELTGWLASIRSLSVTVCALGMALWLAWQAGLADSETIFARPAVAVLLVASIVAQSLSTLYSAYLKGKQRFDLLARLSLGTSLVQVAGVGAGAWVGGVEGALVGYLIPALVGAFLAVPLIRFGRVPRDLRRKVFSFSAASWCAGVIGGLVWSRSEILFLEAYSGLEAVGHFAAAATLTGVATTLPGLLTSALLPYFSEQHTRDARDRMSTAYRTMTLIVSLLGLPACFGVAAIAPVLVPLLLGPDFADAVPATQILLIPAAFGLIAATTPNLIYGVGKSQVLLYTNLFGLVATIALGFLVIPSFGLIGAAWARAAVHVSILAAETWYVTSRLGFAPPWRPLGAVAIAASICGLAAHLAVVWIGGPLALFVAIPVGVLLFGIAVRAMGVVAMFEPELLQRFMVQPNGLFGGLASWGVRIMSPTLRRQTPHA